MFVPFGQALILVRSPENDRGALWVSETMESTRQHCIRFWLEPIARRFWNVTTKNPFDVLMLGLQAILKRLGGRTFQIKDVFALLDACEGNFFPVSKTDQTDQKAFKKIVKTVNRWLIPNTIQPFSDKRWTKVGQITAVQEEWRVVIRSKTYSVTVSNMVDYDQVYHSVMDMLGTHFYAYHMQWHEYFGGTHHVTSEKGRLSIVSVMSPLGTRTHACRDQARALTALGLQACPRHSQWRGAASSKLALQRIVNFENARWLVTVT